MDYRSWDTKPKKGDAKESSHQGGKFGDCFKHGLLKRAGGGSRK